PDTLSYLSAHTCLVYPYWSVRDAWTFSAADGRIHTIPVKNRLWCNNGDALMNAAISGLGVVLQPDFIVHQAIREGRLVEILGDFSGPEIDIHALYAPSAFMPIRTRSFIDFLMMSFAKETPWTV
ncbi:MAG: substrate binding domain-containing protein, partial [Geminicoccaceae bacterium]